MRWAAALEELTKRQREIMKRKDLKDITKKLKTNFLFYKD